MEAYIATCNGDNDRPEYDLQRRITHAVGAQDSQCIESLRAVGDDTTNMIGRRQTICNDDADNLERRDSDLFQAVTDMIQLDLPLCVDYDNFLRLRSVQRQVVSSCPRLDVVNLGRPRVSVVGRDDEVLFIG
mgnify:CR=1 FL=1